MGGLRVGRRSRPRGALSLALCSLLLQTACPRRVPDPGGPRLKTPDELIAAASDRASKLDSIAGEMKIDSFDRRAGLKGRIKAEASFLVRRPTELRVDVMDAGGIPLVTGVMSPEAFALYDMRAKAFYYGPPTACSAEHLLGLALPPPELVRALLGEAPLLEGGRRTLKYERKHRRYRLTIRNGELEQECSYEEKTLRPRECVLRRGGEREQRLVYEDWGPVEGVEGVSLPRRIYFEQPLRASDILIKIRKVWRDPDMHPEAFTLVAPSGVSIVPVCEGELPLESSPTH